MSKTLIRFVINSLIGLGFIAYPIVYFFYQNEIGFNRLALFMMSLWGLRFWLETKKVQKTLSIVMVLFFGLILLFRSAEAMYWYPVMVSSLFLLIFAGSLFTEQSFIERIARLKEPNLSKEGVIYTRKVTLIWIVYFCLNILLTIYYIYNDNHRMWALYTGLISYVMMACLFTGEWCYRYWVIKK